MKIQALRPTNYIAGAVCLAIIAGLSAALVAAPWVWRIPLAVLFVLALRYVAARPAIAEWTLLRWPALIGSALVAASIAYLAIYGLP